MSLFVKEITCENEFPDIVSVVCVNGSGVLDERDYVPERTCEGHRCEETGEWVCHKCGGSLAGCMFDPVRDGFVDVPNFCPNCGSKAVK